MNLFELVAVSAMTCVMVFCFVAPFVLIGYGVWTKIKELFTVTVIIKKEE